MIYELWLEISIDISTKSILLKDLLSYYSTKKWKLLKDEINSEILFDFFYNRQNSIGIIGDLPINFDAINPITISR